MTGRRRRVPPSVAEAGVGTAAADDPSCSRSVGGWGGGPRGGLPGLRERAAPQPSEARPPVRWHVSPLDGIAARAAPTPPPRPPPPRPPAHRWPRAASLRTGP